MSLTSFLRDHDEVSIVLDSTFEKPDIRLDTPRQAEPQTSNYALIGTAFDYVLRFWLERQYDDATSKPWVAHTGHELAQLMEIDVETNDGRKMSTVLANAEQNHQEYLDTGKMTDELLASTLDLARFDWVYRSSQPPKNLGEAASGDIDDLRQLYTIIPESEFMGATSVLLNPKFGSASQLVSGADADIILDGTLLDVKTVKEPTVKPDYWRQLVGYTILADLASDEFEDRPEITEVGLYFARHGVVWRTSAKQIHDHEKYEQFKSALLNRC